MYTPEHFRQDDPATLAHFIDTYNFATLVTGAGQDLLASHVPLLFDQPSRLLAHIARANPQLTAFERGETVLAIFHGPHCYVSPSWYTVGKSVPTWNYTAVHVYGRARVLEPGGPSLTVLERLVAAHEKGRDPEWRFDPAADWINAMARHIAVFEIAIERIEGKFKLSQNRPPQDREAVARVLESAASDNERGVARLMRQHVL